MCMYLASSIFSIILTSYWYFCLEKKPRYINLCSNLWKSVKRIKKIGWKALKFFSKDNSAFKSSSSYETSSRIKSLGLTAISSSLDVRRQTLGKTIENYFSESSSLKYKFIYFPELLGTFSTYVASENLTLLFLWLCFVLFVLHTSHTIEYMKVPGTFLGIGLRKKTSSLFL